MSDSELSKRKGRPRLSQEERKNSTVTFRIKNNLKEAVESLAMLNGKTVSEQVENCVEYVVRMKIEYTYQNSPEEITPPLLKYMKWHREHRFYSAEEFNKLKITDNTRDSRLMIPLNLDYKGEDALVPENDIDLNKSFQPFLHLDQEEFVMTMTKLFNAYTKNRLSSQSEQS